MNPDDLKTVQTMVERLLPGCFYILIVGPRGAGGAEVQSGVLSNLSSAANLQGVLEEVAQKMKLGTVKIDPLE